LPSKKELDLEIANHLVKEGKVDDALRLCSEILNEDPNSAPALYLTAWAFLKGERFGIAYNLLKRSVELNPRQETWNNLGMAAIGMHRLQEAEEFLRKSLKKDPEAAASLGNMALISVYNCDPERAIHYADRAIKADPNYSVAWENKGYAALMQGDFETGWTGYESMLGQSKYRPLKPPHEGCPYWLGEKDLSLYVRGEQGVGDEISFARILPDLLKDGHKVTMECDGKLEGLFQRSFPEIEFVGTRHSKDREWLLKRQFDAHCLVGSLAYHYRRSVDDFPGRQYLVADPGRRLQWRALLDTLPGKKVGIAWTGGMKSTFKARRSFSLEGLLPILKTPGITWVSLQYQDPTEEIEAFQESHGIKIHHWKRASESPDYDDQAALVSELDSVVTVCTAVCHLSGALGKKTYVLVPAKPRWFYGLKGNTLPWYGSVELFRQTDKWPVEKLALKLKDDLFGRVPESQALPALCN
jgi:Tfp pilus assembly protein PilF